VPNPSDKTPGERLVEEWRKTSPGIWNEGDGVKEWDRLSAMFDTLLAEQSAGLVLDLRELFTWDADGPPAAYLDDVLDAIRKQLPGVKVLT